MRTKLLPSVRIFAFLIGVFLISSHALAQCLQGNYSIGAGGNYTTLQDGINDAKAKGICGIVVFQLDSLSYSGTTVISGFQSGTGNQLIVKGKSGANQITKLTAASSSSNTNNYTLLVDNSSGIRFQNIQFERSGAARFASVVSMTNSGHDIQFSACKFTGPVVGSTLLELDAALVQFDKESYSSYKWDSCSFFGGTGGIIRTDSSKGRNIEAFHLSQSIFNKTPNATLKIFGFKNIVFSGNTLGSPSHGSFWSAVDLRSGEGTNRIEKNKITGNEKAISIEYCSGISIINNLVTASYLALNIQNSQWLKIYHNTFISVKTDGTIFLLSKSQQIELVNCILSGGENTIVIDNPSSFSQSDYNVLSANNGKASVYMGTLIPELSQWNAQTGLEANSYSIKPIFGLNYILDRQMIGLSDKGTYLGIAEDLNGASRGSTPDIGAQEFDPYNNNLNVNAASYVKQVFCPGVDTLRVQLINKGVNTIDWVEFAIKIGEDSFTVNKQLHLNSGDTLNDYPLITYLFNQRAQYTVNITGTLLNGIVDEFTPDNKVYPYKITTSMTGVYTLGDKWSDFMDLKSVSEALDSFGICDTVWVRIKSGVHTHLNSSFTNVNKSGNGVLVIESESGIPEMCTERSTTQFSNCRNIIIRNIRFQSSGLVFNGVSQGLILEGNIFLPDSNNSTSGNYTPVGIWNPSIASNGPGIIIRNNSFYNVGQAVDINCKEDLVIENNKVESFYHIGLQVNISGDLVVRNNRLISNVDSFYANQHGVLLLTMTGEALIENNYVSCVWHNPVHLYMASNPRGLVFRNNFLKSEHRKFYFENLNLPQISSNTFIGNGTAGELFYLNGTDSANWQNNIIHNLGTGYIFNYMPSYMFGSNNIFSGDTISLSPTMQLAAWQNSGKETGSQIAKLDFAPLYGPSFSYSGSQTFHANPASNLTKDILGQGRTVDGLPGCLEGPMNVQIPINLTLNIDSGTLRQDPGIYLNLKNESSIDTLRTFQIELRFGQKVWKHYHWSGKLEPGGQQDSIYLGNYLFKYTQPESIDVNLMHTNHCPMDSVHQQAYHLDAMPHAFSGFLPIRKHESSFNFLKDAIGALYYSGGVDTITLLPEPGTYDEGILINGNYPGRNNEPLRVWAVVNDSTKTLITGKSKALDIRSFSNFLIRGVSMLEERAAPPDAVHIDSNSSNISIQSSLIHGRAFNYADQFELKNTGCYYGFFATDIEGLHVDGCLIYRDLYLWDSRDLLIERSRLSSDQDIVNVTSLVLRNNFVQSLSDGTRIIGSNIRVEGNEFVPTTSSSALQITGTGNDSDSIYIQNNGFLQNTQNPNRYNVLWIGNSKAARIQHNTFRLIDKYPYTPYNKYIITFWGAKEVIVQNNIFSKPSDSSSTINPYFSITDSSTFAIFDHNYYSSPNLPDTNFVNISNASGGPTQRHTFSYWKNLGYDGASVTGNLKFETPREKSWVDFRFGKPAMQNVPYGLSYRVDQDTIQMLQSNLFISEITTDIDGKLRSTSQPSYGCEEIGGQLAINLELVEIYQSSLAGRCSDSVFMLVRNQGSEDFSHLQFRLEVDGTPNDIFYSGSLKSGDSARVSLYLSPSSSREKSLKVYPIWQGQSPDEYAHLDTLYWIYHKPLNGAYTVGLPDSDFPNFINAMDTLMKYGLCDDTYFLLEDGSHKGGVRIERFFKTSPEIKLTIKSKNGDPESCYFDNSRWNGGGIIILSGTENVSIENIGFKNTFISSDISGIQLELGAKHSAIRGCVFSNVRSDQGKFIFGIGTEGHITTYNSMASYIKVENCTFNFLETGVFNDSYKGFVDSVFVLNSSFNDCRNGIVLEKVIRHYEIRKNRIDTEFGIDLRGANGQGFISENVIRAGFSGMKIEHTDTNALATLIYNNQITGKYDTLFGGLPYTYPLLSFENAHVKFFHNTVQHSRLFIGNPLTESSIHVIAIYYNNSYHTQEFYNNVFRSQGIGSYIYSSKGASGISSDYNVFELSDATFFRELGPNNTLVSQSKSYWLGLGNDIHSQFINPQFSPLPYLRIGNSAVQPSDKFIPEASRDIFGVMRNSQPMPGCYEQNNLYDLRLDSVVVFNQCVGEVSSRIYYSNISTILDDSLEVHLYRNNSEIWSGRFKQNQTMAPYQDSMDINIYIPDFKHGDQFEFRLTGINGVPDLNPLNSNWTWIPDSLSKPVSLLPDQILACNGNSIQLNPGSFDSYFWSDGSTNSTYSSFGNETVWVRLKKNQCTLTDSVEIRTGSGLELNLNADTSICEGQNIELSAIGFNTLKWIESGNNNLVPKLPGYYQAMAIDMNGCYSTDSMELSFLPFNSPMIDSLYSLCDGDSLQVQPGVFDSYLWSTVSNANTYTFHYAGKYWVELKQSGCAQKIDFEIYGLNSPSAAEIRKSYDTLFTNDTASYSYQWYRDGSPIMGETDTFYVMAANGIYQVERINADGCGTLSSSYSGVLAINNAVKLGEWTLYPNPASNHVNLEFPETRLIDRTEIFTIQGKRVNTIVELESGKLSLQLTHLTPGVYILRVYSEGEVYTFKFEKQDG